MRVQESENTAGNSRPTQDLADQTGQIFLQNSRKTHAGMRFKPAGHVSGAAKTALDLGSRSTGARALLALVGAGILAAFVAQAPAHGEDMPNAMRPRSQQYNCLSLDQNGKTLPNPNVSFNCQQNDVQRFDCELMRLRSDAPVMNNIHCFGWRMEDVRPGTGTRTNPSTRGEVNGGH